MGINGHRLVLLKQKSKLRKRWCGIETFFPVPLLCCILFLHLHQLTSSVGNAHALLLSLKLTSSVSDRNTLAGLENTVAVSSDLLGGWLDDEHFV